MNTLKAIYSRRSIRKFNGEDITKKELNEILKSAYASPIGRARFDTLSLTVISNKEILGKRKWQISQVHPIFIPFTERPQ